MTEDQKSVFVALLCVLVLLPVPAAAFEGGNPVLTAFAGIGTLGLWTVAEVREWGSLPTLGVLLPGVVVTWGVALLG